MGLSLSHSLAAAIRKALKEASAGATPGPCKGRKAALRDDDWKSCQPITFPEIIREYEGAQT